MTLLKDIAGQRFGKLEVIKRTNPISAKYNRTTWLCRCDCGNEIAIEGRNLTGSKYQQMSCGCIVHKYALLKTSKINGLTINFIESFDDFKKYAFLHKQFVKVFKASSEIDIYEKFIKKFYDDDQFNIIYENWLLNSNELNTFYNWYKPSLDHIVPVSRDGSNDIENLQFLSVFENLAKRDMTMVEWIQFKQSTNTNSNLFI